MSLVLERSCFISVNQFQNNFIAYASLNVCHVCVFFAADIISTVEFNHTGELLATGDKGGRVVIFQQEIEVQLQVCHLLSFIPTRYPFLKRSSLELSNSKFKKQRESFTFSVVVCFTSMPVLFLRKCSCRVCLTDGYVFLE